MREEVFEVNVQKPSQRVVPASPTGPRGTLNLVYARVLEWSDVGVYSLENDPAHLKMRRLVWRRPQVGALWQTPFCLWRKRPLEKIATKPVLQPFRPLSQAEH